MSDIVRDLQNRILELREEEEEYEGVLKELKLGHTMDIEETAKELGLTNEIKRKAAVEARLGTDETYSRLRKELKDLRHRIAVLEIDEQYEQRKHQRWHVNGLKDATRGIA